MLFPITIKLSYDDMYFLRQLALENTVLAEVFASKIVAEVLNEYRDEARWADIQEERDLAAVCAEKIVEETLDF